jgi:cytochrome c peroxidase
LNELKKKDPQTPKSRRRWYYLVAAIALILLARAIGPDVIAFANPPADPHRAEWKKDYEPPTAVPYPADDPYSAAKVRLGKMLFFDPILSGSGKIACASCHIPSHSFTDGRRLAMGVKEMSTHTPTLLNVAWAPILAWDGHSPSLEKFPFGPILNPGIMGGKEEQLIAALKEIPGYRQAFAEAFPDHAVSRTNIELALATFERTIVSGPAPFDRWIAGDESAISESAKRGFDLFNGKAGCANCHIGWAFTDEGFYDVGVSRGDDIGRGKLFPNSTKLKYAFKVPTLRDVARRAPYMHNGSEPDLASVIDLYDRGGIDRPSRSELIKPLHLTAQEKADLITFLETLTSEPGTNLSAPILPRQTAAISP